MSFDVGTIIGDALLAVAGVASSYTARRSHTNSRKLDRLANGALNARIVSVVTDVLAKREGDEIRELLNAIIAHSREPDR